MLRGLFKDDLLYFKIWKNEVEIIDVEKGIKLKEKSNTPFSSLRLLIADFEIAEEFFKKVLKKLKKNNKIMRNYSILCHPMELTEGGLSETEKRIFLESCGRLNGRLVKIWEGDELTNRQVIEKLKSRKNN